MGVTLLVEPDPGGHRFQSVAALARVAGETSDVVLLTSRGARERDEYATQLGDVELEVVECFDEIVPPTRAYAAAIAEQCRSRDVDQAVLLDADQALKKWWLVAAQEFRGLPRRPRITFMLTRYPARLTLSDRVGLKMRVTKAGLALAAMATRTVDRVVGYAGREDMAPGLVVKRVRDFALCTAHSRDRAALRAELGLPASDTLVGIFGVISARKFAPLVLDAIVDAGLDAKLLLGGKVFPETAEWLAALPEDLSARVIVRDGFHPDDVLDKLVAASDVVALAMTNNGPSGIMGKAWAAGVPVVTAGSLVRAREVEGTGNGTSAELTVASFGAGLRRVLARDWDESSRHDNVPIPTQRDYAAVLLGLDLRAAPDRVPG